MPKQIPIIAVGVNVRLRKLVEILGAGGDRDGEIIITGAVWSNRADGLVKRGVICAVRDGNGEVVCYRQLSATVDVAEKRAADPAQTWQKTPSGGVHTMQLKVGRRGRVVPACQRVTPEASLAL